MQDSEFECLILGQGDGDCPLFPVNYGVSCLQPWMSQDGIFFSSVDDIEMDLLGDVSQLDIDNNLISTNDI